MRFKINKWLTFIGFCLNTYVNGICFGIFNVYLSTFALYYNLTQQLISASFFIGLIVQIILCVPAMKLLEWRLDYSIWAGSFLTATSYWLFYLANRDFVFVFAAYTLASIGQAAFLPTGLFLSDRWFLLEERSFTIGASFYMNLLGFTSGTILTATYVKTNQQRIKNLYLILGIMSSIAFVIGLFFIRNKPKTLVEQQSSKISFKNLKFLWRYKFLTYGIIMTSVFLGVSWSFVSIVCDDLPFSDQQQIILIFIWIISGVFFGILMSFGVNKWVQKTGNFGYYDIFGKIVLFIGILGYMIMAICFQLQVYNFGLFIFLMIIIGIGSIGFYGLIYLSLLETLHPLPPLIIGTIISAFASVYSALIDGVIIFINESYYYYYIMTLTSVLPWLYLVLTYKTRVKRYKYYLNEKESKFQLLKVQNQIYELPSEQNKDKQ